MLDRGCQGRPAFHLNDLAISYLKIGESYASLGNLNQALEYFEQYAEMRKELYSSHPQNVSFKNGLAITYAILAQFYRDHQNDPSKAKSYFQSAQQLWEELIITAPKYAEFKRFLNQVNEDLNNL